MKTPKFSPTTTLGTPLGYLDEHKSTILQYDMIQMTWEQKPSSTLQVKVRVAGLIIEGQH